MDDSLRRLLRSIALGLPLVVPGTGLVLAPTLLACHCNNYAEHVPQVRVVDLTSDEVGEEGQELVACEAVCTSRFGEAPASCTHDAPTSISCVYERTVMHECGGAGRRADAPATSFASRPRDWLVDTALLEASAVTAFRRTARALATHGAPRSLVRRSLHAANDERRHTARIVALAARTSSVSIAVRTDVKEVPSLEALALENAREGCVGEAWGALEAHVVAARAEDPCLRAEMAAIARDEAMHALFSLDLDAWVRRGASASLTRALDDARADAHARLRASVATREPVEVRLGLPTRELAERLVNQLAA